MWRAGGRKREFPGLLNPQVNINFRDSKLWHYFSAFGSLGNTPSLLSCVVRAVGLDARPSVAERMNEVVERAEPFCENSVQKILEDSVTLEDNER